jgi:hypothetical protein
MGFTVVGFYEDQDGGGALHEVAAMTDDHVTASGDDLRVPDTMINIIGKAALSEATTLTSAKILAPSLKRVFDPHIGVLVNAIVFGNPPESMMHPMSPTPLTKDESVNVQINSDAAAATDEYAFLWLSDGPLQPVRGKIYTMRATSAITLVHGKWTFGELTFDSKLPAGRYAIVGMRAQGTNLIAARLNIKGSFWRPGCPAVNALGDRDSSWFRNGNLGVWGEFDQTTPPGVECVGVTDTSQVIFLDLIPL